MTTTTISKFPIKTLLNSHNTRVPSYQFEIDLIGTGVDAFVGQISKKHGFRFKDRDQAGLRKLLDVYFDKGSSQGLVSEIPGWAWQREHSFYQGIDISQPLEMTLWNGEQRLGTGDEADLSWMIDFVDEDHYGTDAADLMTKAPYLYARDTYRLHASYSVTTDKPFNPDLISLHCEDVLGCRFITRFDYDGQTFEPELVDRPYADPKDRIVQILFK